MSADTVVTIAKVLESNLWDHVALTPPDHMTMRDLCLCAAQIKISDYATRREGCSVSHATAFILAVDDLHTGIELLGGFARIKGSLIEATFIEAEQMANGLLDMLANR